MFFIDPLKSNPGATTGHVSMVINALTYTHGFMGISSKGWQSFKGTTRYLCVFDELYSSISIKIFV